MPGRGRTRHAPVSVRPGRVLDLETVLFVCARLPGRYALMVVVGAFTGMRWGEACAMRRVFLHLPPADAAGEVAWYEVNARVGAVHEDVHAHRYFASPKGGCGRVVDLPPFLAALLSQHIDAAGGRELLFANRHREPIRHTDWLHIWHAACEGDGADALCCRGRGSTTCATPTRRCSAFLRPCAMTVSDTASPECARSTPTPPMPGIPIAARRPGRNAAND